MAIYTIELDGKQYDIEGNRPPTEEEAREAIGEFSSQQQTPQIQESPSITGLPQDITDNPRIQPQNILGQASNVPAAALRSLLQGKGYMEGALQPDQVRAPSEILSEQSLPIKLLANVITGGSPGMKMDFATDPMGILTSLQGGGAANVANKTMKSLKPLMKFEKIAEQAEISKSALEALKKSYGSVYEVALNEVKDVATKVDFGKMPMRVLNKIKEVKDVYGVEFNPNGSIKNTIGNISKIKEAANDMISPSQMKEFTNKEIAQVGKFAEHISQEMKIAARGVKKPIDEAMKLYGEFRKNYDLINDRLLDKRGAAMANKLKEQTRLTADETVKNAWKVLSKESPELKNIMNSRKNREIIKLLLKTTPIGAGVVGSAVVGARALQN